MRLAIVVSDFNAEITSRLLEGALTVLQERGVRRGEVEVLRVPGTFEIPLAAKKLAQTKKWDAIVALGCVIRGETVHFDVICNTTASSLQSLSLETGVPILCGIVMAEDWEQALERSGGRVANRGKEAALAALQMTEVLKTWGFEGSRVNAPFKCYSK